MTVFSIILTIIFLLILVVYLFFSSKRKTLKNIYCLITNIITFIMTFLFTKLSIAIIGGNIIPSLSDFIKDVLNINKEEWVNDTSIELVTKFISTIIIGLISFSIIFIILFIINHLLKRLIFKLINKVSYSKYDSIKHDNKVVNVGLSFVSFVIISYAFLYPIGTSIKIIDESTSLVNYNISAIKPLINNPVLKLYSNGISESIFNSVTSIKDNDNHKIKATEELKSFTTIILALSQINESNNISEQTTIIKESFTNTYLAPTFVSELFSNAALRYKENQSFMGSTFTIPEDGSKDLYLDLLDIVSKWDRDSLVDDIDTIFELYDLLSAHDIFDLDDQKDILNALQEDEFTEDLFLCLFRNEDFKLILSSFMNYGIKSSLSSYNIDLNVDYIETAEIMKLSDEEIKNEARIFSLTVRQLIKLNDAKGQKLSKDEYIEIATNLSEIHKSKILSESIYNLMNKLLQSAA